MNRSFLGVAAAMLLLLLGVGLWLGMDPESQEEDPRGSAPRYKSKQVGRLCREMVETSGLTPAGPGKFWAINDSGEPLLWEVKPRGKCRAVSVTGAQVVDWEALAGHDGYLYIGDIGDNLAGRSEIVVYRIAVDHPGDGAEALRFTYPKGPRDAESMLLDPSSGDLFVISKGARPTIFRAAAPLTAGSTRLERVGRLRFDEILPGPTDAAISSDGSKIVVVTYLGAYETEVGERSVEQALLGAWREIALPVVEQREAVTYAPDGRSFYWTSEGQAQPLFRTRRRTPVR